ncbi:hypothetical protein V527_12765 [Pseudomonas aeruginosa VRFPA06]|nr:hypothetical protein V527_12765 [Pseudomonas aeruginosa VRFPA06]
MDHRSVQGQGEQDQQDRLAPAEHPTLCRVVANQVQRLANRPTERHQVAAGRLAPGLRAGIDGLGCCHEKLLALTNSMAAQVRAGVLAAQGVA